MNTLQKSILATSAALALATGAALTPLAAFGAAGDPTPSSQTQQGPSDGPVVERVGQDTSIPGVSCPGEQPQVQYGADGLLTPESARKLLAAGCTTTDGSELEERAAPEMLGGPGAGAPSPGTASRPGGGSDRSTQPSTGLPRVAG